MEFNGLIEARRSVRRFNENGMIDSETIRALIEKAMLAPSWKNTETARYYVANTPEAIAKVSEALPSFNRSSSANAALIVTTFVKDTSGFTDGTAENELSNKWGAYDLGLNNAYFILAAKDAGLDTLIMGIRDAGALRQSLNIPKTEQITAVIALGYGAVQPGLRSAKSAEDVARFI